MEKEQKVVVLGLDGATFQLIKPLVEEGRMPNMKRLLEQGTHGILRSTVPALTGPAWTTFATGKNPGKHGIIDFLLPQDSLGSMKIATSKDIKSKTILEMMEEEDKTPITINLPQTWPPRGKHICVTGLLTQGTKFIYPEGIEEEIPELKKYRLTPREDLRVRGQDDEYVEDVLKLEKERWEAVKKIYLTRPWDFFFFLFSGTDWVSHRKYVEMYEQREELPLKMFEYADEAIGWMMDHLPEDTTMIVMSDHGFTAHHKIFYLNKWLEKEGYLVTKTGATDFSEKATARGKAMDQIRGKKKTVHVGSKLFDTLGKNPAVYKSAKWAYHNVLKKLPISVKMDISLDIPKTKACLPRASYVTNIYMNDVARYKDGAIQTPEEKEALRKEIKEKIAALRYDGKPLVTKVLDPVDIYGDNIPERAPDIFFEIGDFWIDGHFSAPSIVEDEAISKHSMEGIFLAYGKNVEAGKEITDAQIADVAPTIMHMMGMDIPDDMDGSPLKNIFKEGTDPATRQPTFRKSKTEKDRIMAALDGIKL